MGFNSKVRWIKISPASFENMFIFFSILLAVTFFFCSREGINNTIYKREGGFIFFSKIDTPKTFHFCFVLISEWNFPTTLNAQYSSDHSSLMLEINSELEENPVERISLSYLSNRFLKSIFLARPLILYSLMTQLPVRKKRKMKIFFKKFHCSCCFRKIILFIQDANIVTVKKKQIWIVKMLISMSVKLEGN